MSDKKKRSFRSNYRFFLPLLFVLIIVGLLVFAFHAIQAPGAEIVFIAPGDNYVNNIWIADLNNPENPRQLTWFTADTHVSNNLHVIDGAKKVVYTTSNSSPDSGEIWLLDLETGESQEILSCDTSCYIVDLHPNGRWLAYMLYREGELNLEVLDLQTLIQSNVQTQISTTAWEISATPQTQWIGDSENLIVGNRYEQSNEMVLYDIEEDAVFEENTWYEPGTAVFFSPNGMFYVAVAMGYEGFGSFTIRSYTNPNEVLHEFTRDYKFIAWYPDSNQILIAEPLIHESVIRAYKLSLFNIITGRKTELFECDDRASDFYWYLPAMNFNAEGNQILYTSSTQYYGIFQIAIYDMESAQEIPLPLFGSNPQWVN